MLQKQTTSRATYQLLERIMSDAKLTDFSLAGGTAIALYLGHRESIDLDLFSSKEFDASKLETYLKNKYDFITDFKRKNTLKGSIQGVKVDFITFNYPLCDDVQYFDNIRLYSLKDIIAMKLLAIADNGTRLKDFVDIAYLSEKYSWAEMLHFAEIKFSNKNPLIFEKALLFHEDISFDMPIETIKVPFKWKKIERRLNEMVDNRYKIFKPIS